MAGEQVAGVHMNVSPNDAGDGSAPLAERFRQEVLESGRELVSKWSRVAARAREARHLRRSRHDRRTALDNNPQYDDDVEIAFAPFPFPDDFIAQTSSRQGRPVVPLAVMTRVEYFRNTYDIMLKQAAATSRLLDATLATVRSKTSIVENDVVERYLSPHGIVDPDQILPQAAACQAATLNSSATQAHRNREQSLETLTFVNDAEKSALRRLSKASHAQRFEGTVSQNEETKMEIRRNVAVLRYAIRYIYELRCTYEVLTTWPGF